MPHPLHLARPSDPFLRLRLVDQEPEDFLIVGDHVAFVRRGRRSEETWVSALGNDPVVVLGMLEQLAARQRVDGIHVDADVYLALPERWRADDHGYWSLWILGDDAVDHENTADVLRLDAADTRIADLLTHSESAYLFPGDPTVDSWWGIEDERELADGTELVAVGGLVRAHGMAHLVSVCTAPSHRGRGLARRVCAALVREGRRGAGLIWLEMYADNRAAASVYASLGFVEQARYRSGFLPA